MDAKSPITTPRKCIFCGSRRDITREHVVPDWLRRVILRATEEHTHLYNNIEKTMAGITLEPIIKVNKGNTGNRKLFMVCKICNNGWMSKLQELIIPVLRPLVNGVWTDFDEAAAAHIARWSAMTVSVIAMSFRKTLGVTTEDRAFIKEFDSVPKNWLIWIGRSSGADDITYSNRVATFASKSRGFIYGKEPNVCLTTIVIGQLIIHSLSHPDSNLLPNPFGYGENFGVFPVHPWGGSGGLDWRLIPILSVTSPAFTSLQNEYVRGMMLPFATASDSEFIRQHGPVPES